VRDWNVVVTVRGDQFDRARHLLAELGAVSRTGLYNVLTVHVSDVPGFVGALDQRIRRHPELAGCLGRVAPVTRTFGFRTAEEFEARARAAALEFAPLSAGKAFHVRFHRRGFKGRLSSPAEERFLDEALLDALRAAGYPGRIAFDDPDAVLDVETVGDRAGLAVWTRDELRRFPFLRPDWPGPARSPGMKPRRTRWPSDT
jgi:tRNA(Ser,Leu) C12 N-acetylase TAN1